MTGIFGESTEVYGSLQAAFIRTKHNVRIYRYDTPLFDSRNFYMSKSINDSDRIRYMFKNMDRYHMPSVSVHRKHDFVVFVAFLVSSIPALKRYMKVQYITHNWTIQTKGSQSTCIEGNTFFKKRTYEIRQRSSGFISWSTIRFWVLIHYIHWHQKTFRSIMLYQTIAVQNRGGGAIWQSFSLCPLCLSCLPMRNGTFFWCNFRPNFWSIWHQESNKNAVVSDVLIRWQPPLLFVFIEGSFWLPGWLTESYRPSISGL